MITVMLQEGDIEIIRLAIQSVMKDTVNSMKNENNNDINENTTGWIKGTGVSDRILNNKDIYISVFNDLVGLEDTLGAGRLTEGDDNSLSYDKERVLISVSKRRLEKLDISNINSNSNSNINNNNNNVNVIETTADITSKEEVDQLLLKALDVTFFLAEKIIKSLGPIIIDGGGLAFKRFTEARLLNEPLPEVVAVTSVERLKLNLIHNNDNNNSSYRNDQSINSNSTIATSTRWLPLAGFIREK